MRNLVSKPHALLFVMAMAYLNSSCSKHEPVLASNGNPADVPTVAVAKVSTEDLSHGLVLTAEFRPFQEVDVMAKVAGFVKQINVDVGDRVKQGQLLATLEIPEMADDLRRADAAVVRARAEWSPEFAIQQLASDPQKLGDVIVQAAEVGQKKKENGSGPAEVNATVKAYTALKLAGEEADGEPLSRARELDHVIADPPEPAARLAARAPRDRLALVGGPATDAGDLPAALQVSAGGRAVGRPEPPHVIG